MTHELEFQSPCILHLAAVGCPTHKVPVTSLAQASLAFAKYRDFYGFGGSQMKRGCGNIYGADGKTLIAHVSYNGRVWADSAKNWTPQTELLQENSERQ